MQLLLAAPVALIWGLYEKNVLRAGREIIIPERFGGAVLITGSSAGLGLEAAKQFAMMGGSVMVQGPDWNRTARAAQLVRDVLFGGPAAKVTPLVADLGAFGQVHRLADEVKALLPKAGLQKLVLNAAFMYSGEPGEGGLRGATRPSLTPAHFVAQSGHDRVMAINHLGHFLLTKLLAPYLAWDATIVVVTGGGAWHGNYRRLMRGPADRIDWENRRAEAYRAYYDSKLANVCFSRSLRHWLGGQKPGAKVVLLDPGWFHSGASLDRTASTYSNHAYLHLPTREEVRWWKGPTEEAAWNLVQACFLRQKYVPDEVTAYFFPPELFWWYGLPSMWPWRDSQRGRWVQWHVESHQKLSWGLLHASVGPNCGGREEAFLERHWWWSARQTGVA